MADRFASQLQKLIQAAQALWAEKGLETAEAAGAPRLERWAHFWVLVAKSFARNKCPLRATALAYTTLMALVPLLALVVSVTSALLKEKGESATRQMIEQFVDAAVPQLRLVPRTPDQPVDARTEVVNRIQQFISNVQTTALGATGVVGLIVVAILLLATIEDTFNEIWGVPHGRNWFRRVMQYWTALSLGPVLLALVVVLAGSAYSQSAQALVQTLPWVGRFVLRLLPFGLVSIAFALLYKLMPNTQVHWSAAWAGGIVGGCLWLLLNIGNAISTSRVVSISKIYGTALGLVPIFLIGLYFSWLILLFGAQVAYAYQNRHVYVQQRQAESLNQRGREYAALRVMTHLAERFDRQQGPATVLQVAAAVGLPTSVVSRVLQPLAQAGLVLEVAGPEPAFVPARPLESITCHDILECLRTGGGVELGSRDDPACERTRAVFDKIADAERCAAAAVTLKQLVASARPLSSGNPATALGRAASDGSAGSPSG